MMCVTSKRVPADGHKKSYKQQNPFETMNHVFKLHAHVIKSGFHKDPPYLRELLLSCIPLVPASLSYARSVFDSISCPDIFSWNTIIRAHAHTSPEHAVSLFCKMRSRNVPLDHFTFPFVLKACARLQIGQELHSLILKLGFDSHIYVQNALINIYGCCGSVELALKMFDEVMEKDLVSWSSLISCFVHNGFWYEALAVFQKMQLSGNTKPDEVTILSVLSAVSSLGDFEMGRWVHFYIHKSELDVTISLGTALINMYSRCGSIEESIRVFNGMPVRNLLTWSAMINGLAVHGRSKEALMFFSDMKESGIQPDSITINAVLVACSHGGLLEDGWRIFESIRNEYGIDPKMEHYGCMVDLLGRLGLVYEAFAFVKRMPIRPNSVIWRTLLGACVNHCHVELAEEVKERIYELDPCHDGDLVLLSNAYGGVGRWVEKAMIRNSMGEKRIGKNPGYSSINANGVLHEFFSGEDTHPHFVEIKKFLISIIDSLKAAGYTPCTDKVLFDIEEEEKEHSLSYHSEKLAVAFALLSYKDNKTIRIMKNLRTCHDCHCFMKHISIMFDKEIIMRDQNRFHHFSNGSCSCQDYW